jgi:hypothetical protein
MTGSDAEKGSQLNPPEEMIRSAEIFRGIVSQARKDAKGLKV